MLEELKKSLDELSRLKRLDPNNSIIREIIEIEKKKIMKITEENPTDLRILFREGYWWAVTIDGRPEVHVFIRTYKLDDNGELVFERYLHNNQTLPWQKNIALFNGEIKLNDYGYFNHILGGKLSFTERVFKSNYSSPHLITFTYIGTSEEVKVRKNESKFN